jgi:hypothetical protein
MMYIPDEGYYRARFMECLNYALGYVRANFGELPPYVLEEVTNWGGMGVRQDYQRRCFVVHYDLRGIMNWLTVAGPEYLQYSVVHEIVHLAQITGWLRLGLVSWEQPPGMTPELTQTETNDPMLLWAEGVAEYAAVQWELAQNRPRHFMMNVIFARCLDEAQQAGYIPNCNARHLRHLTRITDARGLRQGFARLADYGYTGPLSTRWYGLGLYLSSLVVAKKRRTLQQLIQTPMTEAEFIKLALG